MACPGHTDLCRLTGNATVWRAPVSGRNKRLALALAMSVVFVWGFYKLGDPFPIVKAHHGTHEALSYLSRSATETDRTDNPPTHPKGMLSIEMGVSLIGVVGVTVMAFLSVRITFFGRPHFCVPFD